MLGAAGLRRQTPPLGACPASTTLNLDPLVEEMPGAHQSGRPTHCLAGLAAANRDLGEIQWPPGGWRPALRRGPWESLLRRPRERVVLLRLRGAGPRWRRLAPGSEGRSAGRCDGRHLGRWENRLRPGCRRGGAAGPRSSQVRGRRARCAPLSPRAAPARPVPVCPIPAPHSFPVSHVPGCLSALCTHFLPLQLSLCVLSPALQSGGFSKLRSLPSGI